MQFTLRHVGGYLRGDLYHRQSAEETSQFLQALTKEALGSAVDRVLSLHAQGYEGLELRERLPSPFRGPI